jgi:hypothetical protein
MARMWIAAAAAAVLAAGGAGSAAARPLSWDCDTQDGHFSQLEMVQEGPSYRISGRITPVELRTHRRYAPMAAIRIQSDGDDWVGIRIGRFDGRRLEARLARSVGGRMEESAFASLESGAAFPFELSLSADGAAAASLGTARAGTEILLGFGGRVQLTCSTGEFLFEGIELEAGAR